MATQTAAHFLTSLDAAVNAGNLVLARQMLSGVNLSLSQNCRLFELAAIVELKSGRPDLAAPLLQKGIACQDASALCHYLLGSYYLSQREFAPAVGMLRTAVNMGGRFLECYYNLSMALLHLSRFDEALKYIEAAMAIGQDSSNVWYAKGLIMQSMNQYDDAVPLYLKALQLAPDYLDALVSLGHTYQAMGKKQEAVNCFRSAIDRVQDGTLKEQLNFMVASLNESAVPEKMPDHYVRDIFDRYADTFDETLVGKLEYKVPQILYEYLLVLGGNPWSSALDMGCGTGLFGKLVRNDCHHLVGVDLSSKMVERAATLGIYDELQCADIIQHLESIKSGYDLVVAADVFVYIGNLSQVFASVVQSMHKQAKFCFTVELLDDDASAGAGYTLAPSGRYKHSDAYILSLAEKYGFNVLNSFVNPARMEQGVPVPIGFYFLECNGVIQ